MILNMLQANVLVPARLTCGVVFSDTDIGASINGAHLSYWCGQFFTGRDEQTTLLNWLRNSMDKIKWPNRTCIERLQKLWGMKASVDGTLDSPPIV